MKKLFFVGLSVLLSACGVDKSEYEISYYENDSGVISGNTLGFYLYEEVVVDYYRKVFNSSKSLSSDYSVSYRDSIGNQVSDSAYNFGREINKGLKKCSNIKLNKGDIVYIGGRWNLFGRIYSTLSFDYKIGNKQKIIEIQSCADKAMAEIPLDLDILARFTADDRLEKYQSTELNNRLIEVKSDGKFTFNELFSVYKILDKNIENNINSNFMKSI